MSRYFMIQSWVGSHENEPDYNGQQAGERNVRSSEVVPLYDRWGNANVLAFSDEAIAARNSATKPVSKVSIKDRILPQYRRLSTLQSQMVELEQGYRSGEMDIVEYSLLRDCLVAKKERAEALYRKAISVKPKSYEEESQEDEGETYASACVNTQESASVGSDWIDDLSPSNSLKKPLKVACKIAKGLIRFTSATKRYIKTLQEV